MGFRLKIQFTIKIQIKKLPDRRHGKEFDFILTYSRITPVPEGTLRHKHFLRLVGEDLLDSAGTSVTDAPEPEDPSHRAGVECRTVLPVNGRRPLEFEKLPGLIFSIL